MNQIIIRRGRPCCMLCAAELMTPQSMPNSGPHRLFWESDHLLDLDPAEWAKAGAWFCSECFESPNTENRIYDRMHAGHGFQLVPTYVAQKYSVWLKEYLAWADARAREWAATAQRLREKVHV